MDKSIMAYFKASEEGHEDDKREDFGRFEPLMVNVPMLVKELSEVKVATLACGYAFNMAVTDEGQVYGWGFNDK